MLYIQVTKGMQIREKYANKRKIEESEFQALHMCCYNANIWRGREGEGLKIELA